MHGNERLVVQVCEESHGELAVHPVGHTTVAGHQITEILDLERPLQSACKESTERSDERGKGGHGKNVELHGLDVQGCADQRVQEEGEIVGVFQEHRIGCALEASKHICSKILWFCQLLPKENCSDSERWIRKAKSESGVLLVVRCTQKSNIYKKKYTKLIMMARGVAGLSGIVAETDLNGTDEVLVTHQDVCHEHAEQHSHPPGTDETLNGLLRRDLDQLRAAKGDSTDVGEDVVRDDE